MRYKFPLGASRRLRSAWVLLRSTLGAMMSAAAPRNMKLPALLIAVNVRRQGPISRATSRLVGPALTGGSWSPALTVGRVPACAGLAFVVSRLLDNDHTFESGKASGVTFGDKP